MSDVISRQEAENYLLDLSYQIGTMAMERLSDKDGEKIRQCVEALSSGTDPDSDTISRAKAIDEIKEIYEWHDNVTKERIIEHFKQLPPAQLGTNLAEVGTDCISREQAIDVLEEQIAYCDKALKTFGISMKDEYAVKVEKASLVAYKEQLEAIPAVQSERTCVNCGRTANNGGWYADGGTRCPIEEHYALPKDGYCHLWEKRNVTDDDYPERRTDD